VCECLGGKPERAMKVNVDRNRARSTDHEPTGERFELEHICRDPKDGELCQSSSKPGETLVEDRRDTYVQIERQIWE